MSSEVIGLFPLKLVLFPESIVPLHIFEHKFISLIKNNWEKKIPFGINLKVSNKNFDIGCQAEVMNITKFYDDGRMDVVVIGLKRFKLSNIRESKELYNICNAEFFEDIHEELDPTMLFRCINMFNEISDAVRSVKIERISISSLKTIMPSFYIAQKSGISIYQKQELLEMKSENERLKKIYSHLQHILPVVKESEFLSKLIKNDGYFKPKYLS
jgi:Lon protease-like protein